MGGSVVVLFMGHVSYGDDCTRQFCTIVVWARFLSKEPSQPSSYRASLGGDSTNTYDEPTRMPPISVGRLYDGDLLLARRSASRCDQIWRNFRHSRDILLVFCNF